MKKRIWLGACLLMLCVLFACGAEKKDKAAAPLAGDMGQVRTNLITLPEDLEAVELLACTSSVMLSADKNGSTEIYEYRPSSGAYRHMESPVAGTVKAMAAAPDGSLWTVIQSDDGCVLMKSSQGNVLLQQELGDYVPEMILCDSVGHVFAASNYAIHRYSPEGALQASLILPGRNEIAELRLAICQERMFLRIRRAGERSTYTELLPDMTLGDSFDACVAGWNIEPLGSFLKDYLVMEFDSTGLYAYRENGGWETICIWAAQHLDGTVGKHLICDTQGNGVIQYEKGGQSYCLNLSPA